MVAFLVLSWLFKPHLRRSTNPKYLPWSLKERLQLFKMGGLCWGILYLFVNIQVRDFVAACENCKENKHTTQIKRPVMGKDRSTHSKDVPGFLRKISAVSPRKYHAIYRIRSLDQVCVAKSDAEGLIDSCNLIAARRNIHPIRSSGNNPHGQRKTVCIQGIREYDTRIWKYTHEDREIRTTIQCFGESEPIRISSNPSKHPRRPHAMGWTLTGHTSIAEVIHT